MHTHTVTHTHTHTHAHTVTYTLSHTHIHTHIHTATHTLCLLVLMTFFDGLALVHAHAETCRDPQHLGRRVSLHTYRHNDRPQTRRTVRACYLPFPACYHVHCACYLPLVDRCPPPPPPLLHARNLCTCCSRYNYSIAGHPLNVSFVHRRPQTKVRPQRHIIFGDLGSTHGLVAHYLDLGCAPYVL